MIYHITTQVHWNELADDDTYAPMAYAAEKFIHCCQAHQLAGVLARYFKDVKNLVVLGLDETKLTAPLKYEPGTNQELFPHLYGVINKDSIVQVQTL
jgi:uncharacterized protein (DUF952 family)